MRRHLFSLPVHLGAALALALGAPIAVSVAARAQEERAAPAAPASPRPAASPVVRTPAADPWSPLISEASARFGVPELWLREVMRVESGGRTTLNGQLITSHAGAMGLMQVMPGTYADLRARYGLGADPYEPRSNVLAGAAYLREMFNRYGSASATFAAYNAGPGRYDDYRLRGRPLPAETIEYLARLSSATAGPLPNGGAVRAGSLRLPDLADEATTAARAPIFVRLAGGFSGPATQTDGNGTRAEPAGPPGMFVQSAGLFAGASTSVPGAAGAQPERRVRAETARSVVASAEPSEARQSSADAMFVRIGTREERR